MKAAGNDAKADWRTGLTLSGQGILPTMGAVLFVPVTPMIVAEFSAMKGATLWVIALLTVPGLCIALFSPLFGLAGDRFGKRAILVTALLAYGIAGAAPALVTPYGGLLAARTALGLCEAAIMTLSAAMLVDLFEGEQRGRWLANVSLLAAISGTVFAPLGGMIGAAFGWRSLGLVYLTSIAFVPLMLLYTPAAGSSPVTLAGAGAAPTCFPARHMVGCAAATLAGSMLLYGMVFNEGLALNALGVTDSAKLGLLLAVIGLSTPLGSFTFWIAGRYPNRIILPASFALAGASLAATLALTGATALATSLGISLFACGLILPSLLKWTMQDVPACYRGQCSGIFQSVLAAGQFLGGMLVQGLASISRNGIVDGFGLLGIAALIVAALTYWLLNRAWNRAAGP